MEETSGTLRPSMRGGILGRRNGWKIAWTSNYHKCKIISQRDSRLEKVFSSRKVQKASRIIRINDHVRSLSLKVPIDDYSPMSHSSALCLHISDVGNRYGRSCYDIDRITTVLIKDRSGTESS
jgi:hypothetical protein